VLFMHETSSCRYRTAWPDRGYDAAHLPQQCGKSLPAHIVHRGLGLKSKAKQAGGERERMIISRGKVLGGDGEAVHRVLLSEPQMASDEKD